eukprot:gene2472-3058_t
MNDDFPPLGSKPNKSRSSKPTLNNNNNFTTTSTTSTNSAPWSTNNNNNFKYSTSSSPSSNVSNNSTVTSSTTNSNSKSHNIIDIGANLSDRAFQKDLDQILTRSYNKGVNKIVITGTSRKSSIRALEIIQENKKNNGLVELYSTFGVHPHDSERELKQSPMISQEIKEYILKNKDSVKAVGECGLDFNRNFSGHDYQVEMFRKQIELGIELGLPLFIHERDAHQKFIETVDPYVKSGKMPRSVIHCFTGTEAEAITYVKMGFYIGFTGVITQEKRGFELRSILKKKIIPLDRLMIETDCPYMTPHNIDAKDRPPKGSNNSFVDPRRNEPSYLTYVLKTLADCYKISEEEMATQTTNNTKLFFNL